MGGRNRDRVLKLKQLADQVPGYVRVGECQGCKHRSGLPLGLLIAKHGADFPAEYALIRLKCGACGVVGRVEHRLLRLCEPGCARQRG